MYKKSEFLKSIESQEENASILLKDYIKTMIKSSPFLQKEVLQQANIKRYTFARLFQTSFYVSNRNLLRMANKIEQAIYELKMQQNIK